MEILNYSAHSESNYAYHTCRNNTPKHVDDGHENWPVIDSGVIGKIVCAIRNETKECADEECFAISSEGARTRNTHIKPRST